MYSPSRGSPSLGPAPRLGTNALPAPRHKARVKRIYAGDIKAAAGRERSRAGLPGDARDSRIQGSPAPLAPAPKEPNLHFHVAVGAILGKGMGLTPRVGLPSLPSPGFSWPRANGDDNASIKTAVPECSLGMRP